MYRAPEMVDLYMRSSLTEKTDIWALGCLLYAMSFLVHPFQDGSTLSILNARVSFPANSPYSEDLHALILRMLDVRPYIYQARTTQPCLYSLSAHLLLRSTLNADRP
jgi:serine/threonine protein kinase